MRKLGSSLSVTATVRQARTIQESCRLPNSSTGRRCVTKNRANIFLLRDDAPWPPEFDRGEEGRKLAAFRRDLREGGTVNTFSTREELTSQVTPLFPRVRGSRQCLKSLQTAL